MASTVTELSIGFGYTDPLENFEGKPPASDEYLGNLCALSAIALALGGGRRLHQNGITETQTPYTLKDGEITITEQAFGQGRVPTPIERVISFAINDPDGELAPRIFDIVFSLVPDGMITDVEDHGPSYLTDPDFRIFTLSRPLARQAIDVITPIVNVLEDSR